MNISNSSLLLVASFVLTAGCRPAADDHGHAHADEPQTAQITVWTDRYEIFAEHQVPVAGKATTFITHVTDIQTFEPRRNGPVTFVMNHNGDEIEHLQPQPARDGIYLPGLIFPSAGDWNLSVQIPAEGSNATVDLGQIVVYGDSHDAEHATFEEAPEGVSFLKEQQWKIEFESLPVSERDMVQRVDAAAVVRSRPGTVVTIAAPVSGLIVAPPETAFPSQGSPVEEGQLIALLRPEFSEAAAQLADAQSKRGMAKADLKLAEAAYARVRRLAEQKAKSERELQDAARELESARARYAAASSLLGTSRHVSSDAEKDSPLLIELRSPIIGILDRVESGPGEIIAAGAALFTVVDPSTVWIEAPIPEQSIDLLSQSKSAVIEQNGEYIPATGDDIGRLISVGLVIDPVTRTVPVIYETRNNEGRLRIGQRLRLQIETENVERALAVPESAIVEEDGRPIAFVHVSGETFEKRDLQTGIRDRGFVQVLAGVEAGERVVTKGGYAIRLSSVSGVIPAHGHAH